MKLIPSVIEESLEDFGEALWRIQHLGFKKEEINQYGNLIWNALEVIREFTPAAGMSSTGPAIFAITDTDSKSLINECTGYFEENGLRCEVITTVARNRGADIEAI
jgi:beta-ribofuranosylaminobenzene 5'-phosphate synthase